MTALGYRDATREDYPTYLRLVVELGVDDDPGDIEKFTREMMPTTILAERDGRVAGYAYYRMLDGAAHLGHLVCCPTARRTGVGRGLIAETIRRVTALGAKEIALNVKPENTNAIALYAGSGFTARETIAQLRLAWSALDRLSADERALSARARPLEPAQEAAVEARFDLPRGTIASQRTRGGRVLVAIEDKAVASFDPAFPGAYPFRAEDGPHARALVAALRPHARPEDTFVNVSPGANEAVVEALVALGATVRFRTTRMVRPIPPS